MKEFVFATNNPHKLEEVRHLAGSLVVIHSLHDIGCVAELPETQNTLEGNALQKARYVFNKFHLPCFSDDSGLEVAALNGEPGVHSAHYAGSQRNNNDNINLLLEKLKEKPSRQAQFRCVIALVELAGTQLFEGVVRGEILPARKGTQGFGYDPVFRPYGVEKTLAEMTLEEKNRISHRGEAVRKLVDYLREKYGKERYAL